MATKLVAWDDDVPLQGPNAPKGDGQIEHLIQYLLTVHKRFGNTAITIDLQWGSTALYKRDEQKERIAVLEAELDTVKQALGGIVDDISVAFDKGGYSVYSVGMNLTTSLPRRLPEARKLLAKPTL